MVKPPKPRFVNDVLAKATRSIKNQRTQIKGWSPTRIKKEKQREVSKYLTGETGTTDLIRSMLFTPPEIQAITKLKQEKERNSPTRNATKSLFAAIHQEAKAREIIPYSKKK